MKITRRKFILRGFLLASAIFLLDWFWEVFFIKIKEFHLAGANEKTKNLKIIQISDLHLQSIHFGLRNLTQKIKNLQPDLICITGDAVDKAQNIGLLNEFLTLLDKNTPKVAILGNWEYWGKVNLKELKQIYQKHNTQLLVNENQLISLQNTKILLTGVDSLVGGKPDYDLAVENHQLFDYHIVMTHCPAHRDMIAEDYQAMPKIDLILAGHTHGGQINLLGYVPFLPQGSGKYVGGWYKNQEPIMYVSKGIGTSVLPLRIGAAAEIAVFYLNSNQK